MLVAMVWTRPVADSHGPVVLAAASLQPALEEVARAWTEAGRPPPVLSFAATSALARQVMSGARADIFISADAEWANVLERAGKVEAGSRVVLLGNTLVLVGPRGATALLAVAPGFDLARALGKGRLALANPAAVPAGRYAKAALTRLGVWDGVARRIAPAENVRAALAMVERRQTPLAVVYGSDATSSDKVAVVGTFPPGSHPPIRYPMLTIRGSANAETAAFRDFLRSARASAIFRRHGFVLP